ncbi:paired amphipathic helix [Mycena floridula]|nr:paired amphipathic helix [Mycena floridula]
MAKPSSSPPKTGPSSTNATPKDDDEEKQSGPEDPQGRFRPVGAYAEPFSRPVNVADALLFIDLVKATFEYQPHVYDEFLDAMSEFRDQRIDTAGLIERISFLFKGQPHLVRGFNIFLPLGTTMPERINEGEAGRIMADELYKHGMKPEEARKPETRKDPVGQDERKPPGNRSKL